MATKKIETKAMGNNFPSGFPSVSVSKSAGTYERLSLAELLAAAIPDAEQPVQSRLAYLRACSTADRYGSFQLKQLHWRMGKVIATFKDELKNEKRFNAWVKEYFPDTTARNARNWVHYSEKAPEAIANDPATTYSHDCKTFKIFGKAMKQAVSKSITWENVIGKTKEEETRVRELTTGISRLAKTKTEMNGIKEDVKTRLTGIRDNCNVALQDLSKTELVVAA